MWHHTDPVYGAQGLAQGELVLQAVDEGVEVVVEAVGADRHAGGLAGHDELLVNMDHLDGPWASNETEE